MLAYKTGFVLYFGFRPIFIFIKAGNALFLVICPGFIKYTQKSEAFRVLI
jgi:hypothetical protein